MIENKPSAVTSETVQQIEQRIRDNAHTAPSNLPILASLNEEETVSVNRAQNDVDEISQPAPVLEMKSSIYPETPLIMHTQILPAVEEGAVAGSSRMAMRFAKVLAPGLSMRERIRAVPLLGYAFAWFNALIKLPVTRYQQEVVFDLLQKKLALNEDKITQINTRLSLTQTYIDERVAQASAMIEQRKNEAVQTLRSELMQRIVLLERIEAQQRLESLEKIRSESRLHQLEMLDVGSRLMKLEQIEVARKLKHQAQAMQLAQAETRELKELLLQMRTSLAGAGLADSESGVKVPMQMTQSIPSGDSSHSTVSKIRMDQFFSDFEEVFRGEKSEIKRRLEVYLPYVQETLASSPVSADVQVLDVGCGRGEWLELMADRGIAALGIDLNEQKVSACLAAGLKAKSTDAIDYLRALPAGSLSVVTGFHLIEHLSFEQVLALFDAALSALKPDGLLIFETPNPENLLVGACSFYTDPTHKNPIVPAVVEFIAEQSGFAKADILRLHPYPQELQLQGGSSSDQIINQYFYGAQDFALIARK